MARHKEFDPDLAIDKALALFRLRGYEATSVDDLVQALGIGRGSLYDTFGSKHALYLAALDRYLEPPTDVAPPVVRSAKSAIEAILMQQVEQAIATAPLGGCFLVNSVVELAAYDGEVASRARANLVEAEGMFYAILSQDPSRSESQVEQHKLAQFFVNITLGLRLFAKTNPDRTTLTNIVDAAVRVLG